MFKTFTKQTAMLLLACLLISATLHAQLPSSDAFIEPGKYQIKNLANGKNLAATFWSNWEAVDIDPGDYEDQIWNIAPVGDGIYEILLENDIEGEKFLEVLDGVLADGAAVGTDAQVQDLLSQWNIITTDDGMVIKPNLEGIDLVMDINPEDLGISLENFEMLNPEQLWELIPVDDVNLPDEIDFDDILTEFLPENTMGFDFSGIDFNDLGDLAGLELNGSGGFDLGDFGFLGGLGGIDLGGFDLEGMLSDFPYELPVNLEELVDYTQTIATTYNDCIQQIDLSTIENAEQLYEYLDANCAGPSDNIFNSPEADKFVASIELLMQGFMEADLPFMQNVMHDGGDLPLQQPFNIEPFNYDGIEMVPEILPSFVDWVMVYLRDEAGNVMDRKAAMVHRDGTVTCPAGNTDLLFDVPVDGEYYLSVHPKGHLAVVTDMPIASGDLVDFTAEGMTMNENQTTTINGEEVLVSGDFDGNGLVNNLDFNQWAVNSAAIGQYLKHDADGNMIINNIDFNLWFANRQQVGAQPLMLNKF